MHIQLSFSFPQPVDLPVHYNHAVQALIYGSIDPALAARLHEGGFVAQGRSFRLFSFSRLFGKYRLSKEGDSISFESPLTLTISSPIEEFCHSLVKRLLLQESVRLGRHRLSVSGVSWHLPVAGERFTIVRSLSPVVIYSTLLRRDGRKYTCYFQPGEPDYIDLIRNNLAKKHKAFTGLSQGWSGFMVSGLGEQQLSIVRYKGTVIKGFSGRLKLSGPAGQVEFALAAGLGGKNSQGFGCIDLSPRQGPANVIK